MSPASLLAKETTPRSLVLILDDWHAILTHEIGWISHLVDEPEGEPAMGGIARRDSQLAIMFLLPRAQRPNIYRIIIFFPDTLSQFGFRRIVDGEYLLQAAA